MGGEIRPCPLYAPVFMNLILFEFLKQIKLIF